MGPEDRTEWHVEEGWMSGDEGQGGRERLTGWYWEEGHDGREQGGGGGGRQERLER